MRWAASYFAPFERLQREGGKWKWVDLKHHEQKWSSCRIILHFCMSGSVENKRWKLMQKITFVQKMLAIHENQTSNQVYAVDWLFNPTAFWTVNIFKWVQMRFYLQHRGIGYTIFGSVCPFSPIICIRKKYVPILTMSQISKKLYHDEKALWRSGKTFIVICEECGRDNLIYSKKMFKSMVFAKCGCCTNEMEHYKGIFQA